MPASDRSQQLPESPLVDVTAGLARARRTRRAPRLRLVSLFRRGWSWVMSALLTGDLLPLPGTFTHEPWATLPNVLDENLMETSYDDAA